MQKVLLPMNEMQRLVALHRLKILDTPPEERFDRITRLVQKLFSVPVALITLVDEKRVWYKSRPGLQATETPREIAFCSYAILQDNPLIIPDAQQDPRFADNPLIAGPPHYRFYAASQLAAPGGEKLGTLCILDYAPRQLQDAEIDMLRDLAAWAEREINMLDLQQISVILRESQEQLQDFFDNANDLIQRVTPEGRFLYVNRAWSKALGYGEDDIPGLNLMDVIHPDSHAHCRMMLERVCAGETLSGVETVFVAKDGRYISVEGSVNCQFQDGKPFATRGIFRDVTRRKQAEEALRLAQEELRRHRDHLEELVQSRTEELQSKQAQLLQAQKMEVVGRLAGGVAHDFNNLLTAITGYSEFILQSLKPSDQAREDIQEVLKAAQRASSLTRQLLAFSRKQIIQPAVLNLNALVADMEKMLRRLIGENIELVTRFDASLGQVKADPGHMEQVVMNLVVNARDAMSDGGRIVIETSNAEVGKGMVIRGEPVTPGFYVELAISDTGCGMTPEIQSRLFEPFFTTKGEGRGTGLGLATIYEIVKQSGGHITVNSEAGKGSTFKVLLPKYAGIQEWDTGPSQTSRSLLGTETILLVEDDKSVRDLTARVLRAHGYTVLDAGNGDEALLACRKQDGPVHLLLTDIVIPRMSGGELAERVIQTHPGIKVIFMTGYLDPSVTGKGIPNQDLLLLQKPFSPDNLLNFVRKVLDAPVRKG